MLLIFPDDFPQSLDAFLELHQPSVGLVGALFLASARLDGVRVLGLQLHLLFDQSGQFLLVE
jgi:hypothetical protein